MLSAHRPVIRRAPEPMRVGIVSLSKTADIEHVAKLIELLQLGLGQALIFDLDLFLGTEAQVGSIAHLTGEHVTAQREVFSNLAFVELTMSIIETVQSDNAGRCRMYFVVDFEGTYADVVGRTVEHCLNKMEVEFEGRSIRAVECYHWPMTHFARHHPLAIPSFIRRIDTWLHMNLPP